MKVTKKDRLIFNISEMYREDELAMRKELRSDNAAINRCSSCGKPLLYGIGHDPTCEKASRESLVVAAVANLKTLVHQEDKWLHALQQRQAMAGKLAILRHENNKLRKANENMRKALNLGQHHLKKIDA